MEGRQEGKIGGIKNGRKNDEIDRMNSKTKRKRRNVFADFKMSFSFLLAPFGLHYAVFLCAWYYLSGLGYVMSLMMTPRNSQMAAIVTVVIMALMSG